MNGIDARRQLSAVTRHRRPCPAPLLTVALALLGLLAGCGRGGDAGSLAARVDALLDPLIAARELSGAVVLARRSEVVYQRGFGMANRAAGVPFTPETATDGGSLAKTFTAAGVWWLAAEGRIDLDAPVGRYVEEFPHAGTTVRQLLLHSNGLPPYYEFFDPHFASDEVRTTSALLRVVGRELPAPRFPPGSRFEYSNLGYDAAALVIERVTGQGFESFLRERFFSRLGMGSTFARPARLADWQGVRTMGYRWRDGAWEEVEVFDMEGFLGASNLYFSAADLARWGSAHAAGTALPPAVFAAGQERGAIDGHPSPITALSWYCDDSGRRCYWTGSLNAFHGLVAWDRSREETAVLVSNGSLPPWRAITLQRALVDALAGRPVAAEETPAFERFAAPERIQVAGTYVAAGLGAVTVRADGAGVRVRAGDGLELDAFPVDEAVFYVPGNDWWLAFRGGRPPDQMHVRSMFLDTVARRAPAAGGE